MRHHCNLPIPQWEFGFTSDTFNLKVETAIDGKPIARERAEADDVRRVTQKAQSRLFKRKSKIGSIHSRRVDTKTDTKSVKND